MGAAVLDRVRERPGSLTRTQGVTPTSGRRVTEDAVIVLRRPELRGSEATLDGLLVRAWEGLSACHTVACPACGGAMAPRRTTGGAGGALVRRGECGSCATELS